MEQQQRPYFSYSIAELLTLFETQKGDGKILVQLQRELKHRTRPTAVALAAEVEQAIADLQEQKKGATSTFTQAAFPPQAEEGDVEYIARPDDEPKGDGEIEDNPPQSAKEPKKFGNLVGRPSVSIRACGPHTTFDVLKSVA